MSKAIKSMIMRDYKDRVGSSQDGMLIGIRGLKAKDQVKLRSDLRQKSIRVTVVRNSLAGKVLEGTGMQPLAKFLTGSNALAYGGQSVVEIAREIVRLTEKMPAIELKGAVLDGQVFEGKAGCTELSKFPTKDEAIGQAVGLILSPAKNLLAQIAGPASTVAGLIKTIESKLEKGETIAKAG